MTTTTELDPLRAAEAAIEELDASIPAELTEDALAATFTTTHGDELRYCAKWGKWLAWTGTRWMEDETFEVFDRIRRICRDEATRVGKKQKKIAAILSKASTVAAIEKLARADRVHATSVEQWDADPWLLNTPSGIIDLHSGRVRAARPADLMIRQTAAGPGGTAPRWAAFLERITGGDDELVAFLQRIAGYCLTGDTRAHALFFFYGTGGNGKGTFLNTLTHLLGDYARVAPAETFTASRGDRHPTELAMLRGARLVAAQETEGGRRWAEAKIKALTGGDPIAARFMRGDFFTYTPQFKLVIAGNHKPHLQTVDEAIRRRMHLVPFTQTIAPAERIEGLEEQLRVEWPGILAWAIEGCLAWQRDGLNPPAVVEDATEDYFVSEDSFATWLRECCERGPGYRETASRLFENWVAWCERSREQPGTKKAFSTLLQDRGFTGKHGNSGSLYSGLRLLHVGPYLEGDQHVAM